MKHSIPTLLINLCILGLAALVIWLTKNPLALFIVLTLQQVPIVINDGVPAPAEDESEYSESNIGFHTK